MKDGAGTDKFLNIDNKFRMSTTPASENCQITYCNKEVLHDKGLESQITIFVYNYVSF